MSPNLSAVATMSDDPTVKRDVVIRLLVTKDERDAIQAAADAEGLTLSEWIRRRCIKTTTTVEVTPRSREQGEAYTNFYVRTGRPPTADELAAEVPNVRAHRRFASKPTKKGGK